MPRDCRTSPLNDDERRLVREQYPEGDLDALAAQLGLTLHALRDAAWRMGVHRARRAAERAVPRGGIVGTAMRRRTPLEQAWN